MEVKANFVERQEEYNSVNMLSLRRRMDGWLQIEIVYKGPIQLHDLKTLMRGALEEMAVLDDAHKAEDPRHIIIFPRACMLGQVLIDEVAVAVTSAVIFIKQLH